MEKRPTNTDIDVQVYIEVGYELEILNNDLNGGRGISAIGDVASALKRGQVESAKATISNEWDKISTYKKVADYLITKDLFEPIDFSKDFEA